MQEAFASALAHWREVGIPHNSAAWVTAAAHRKLIDAVRREQTRRKKAPDLAYESAGSALPIEIPLANEMSYPDDRLRLMFACCHPALSTEAQVALTLRMLGGLTTAEIARGSLLPEATLAQRLVRAKRKDWCARSTRFRMLESPTKCRLESESRSGSPVYARPSI